MPENRESHTVLLGPWGGNKCCHCCDRCTGRDAEAQNEYNNCTGCPPLCCTCPPLCDLEVTITATCCDGLNGQTITMEKASWPQAPWNGTDNDPLGPRTRVPYPLHYCANNNPMSYQTDYDDCYISLDVAPELCRERGKLHPYEKWANRSKCGDYDPGNPNGEDPATGPKWVWGQNFCAGTPTHHTDGAGCQCSGPCPTPGKSCPNNVAIVPPCAGSWMTFSLCCCDNQHPALLDPDYEGECKSCSYQFQTEWSAGHTLNPTCLPRDFGVAKVCSCYDPGGISAEAIPPDPGNSQGGPDPWVPGHVNGTNMIWTHVDGACGFEDGDDWMMEYRLGTCEDPVHWNCDCCFNTEPDPGPPPWLKPVMPARQAYFTAIITPIADTCQSDGGP